MKRIVENQELALFEHRNSFKYSQYLHNAKFRSEFKVVATAKD